MYREDKQHSDETTFTLGAKNWSSTAVMNWSVL